MTTKAPKDPGAKKRPKQPAYKPFPVEGAMTDVSSAFAEIESLAEEMRETYDNMEGANMGHMSKCEQAGEAADALENVSEVEVPECLEDVKVSYFEMRPTRKGRGTGRSTRLANAISILESAVAAANEADLIEGAADERDEFVTELENAISEVEGVDFPGMFG